MFCRLAWTLLCQSIETENSTFPAVYCSCTLCYPQTCKNVVKTLYISLAVCSSAVAQPQSVKSVCCSGAASPVHCSEYCDEITPETESSVCMGVSSGGILGNTLRSNYIVCNMLIGHLHSFGACSLTSKFKVMTHESWHLDSWEF